MKRGIERELYFTEPTGFPYISPISSGLRWRGERALPDDTPITRPPLGVGPAIDERQRRWTAKLCKSRDAADSDRDHNQGCTAQRTKCAPEEALPLLRDGDLLYHSSVLYYGDHGILHFMNFMNHAQ
jgi:hypothetical protein